MRLSLPNITSTLILHLADFPQASNRTPKQRVFMKRVASGEPTPLVTLFGISRLRATDPNPLNLHFRYLQMNERLGWFIRSGFATRLLTEWISYVGIQGEEVGNNALKVSDSEHSSLVWLTQFTVNGLAC